MRKHTAEAFLGMSDAANVQIDFKEEVYFMAIGIILGIIFGGLTIAGFVLGGIKLRKKSVGSEQRSKGSGLISILVGAAAFLLFLFVPFSFHTVDAGEVAVVKHLGQARNVRTAGTYFDFWMTEKYVIYDAKVQDLSIFTQAYSQDAQTMDIEMTVQYQIDTSKVLEIANTYGSLDILNSRIESVAVDAMKTVMSGRTAELIIQERADLSKSVTDTIMARIDSSYYVNVKTAVLTDIGFTDAYEAAVEAQMIAEREKEAAIIKAEQELEVAQRMAQARLEEAQGEANAQKALSEAEAYSASIKIVELARTLGYEVTETEVSENINYDIQWGEDNSGKELILDYLKYLEYLAKWDGKLPEVVSDGTGIMITLPTDPSDPSQGG